MRAWFWGLKRRHRIIVLVAAAVAVVLITADLWGPSPEVMAEGPRFTVEQSVREVAPHLDVTGMALARELGLGLGRGQSSRNGPVMSAPLSTLGVSQEKLDDAVHHLRSHTPSRYAYLVYAGLTLFAIVFLVVSGQERAGATDGRTHFYPQAVYTVVLLLAVVFAGFLVGKSPNPMEGMVKVPKALVGLYPSVGEKALGLAFFLVLAIVGNKLVCGWACPFGALQELLYKIPILRPARGHKLPFWFTNGVRTTLLVLMLLVLFGAVGGRRGFVLYHGVSPFNLFDREFGLPSILLTVIVSLITALIVYRPFCHIICPFGWISWLAERISIYRVRVDPERCSGCGTCMRACPSQAAADRVNGRKAPADCFSCARCLDVCPEGALRYTHRDVGPT